MACDEGKHGVMLGYEPVYDIPFVSDEAFSMCKIVMPKILAMATISLALFNYNQSINLKLTTILRDDCNKNNPLGFYILNMKVWGVASSGML